MPFTSRLQTLARHVARFDWVSAPLDTAANLYQTVIPAAERRQLGEYYTPSWLARVMVRELVDDPLNQRVLDPACGSGTFVAEAVTHFIAAAEEAGWAPENVLSRLRDAVTGIDVHPVAVHLARAAWILAAHPAVRAATTVRLDASMSIPVYLGDALQLRFRTGDMFAGRTITIQTMDEDEPELVFPVSLVERAEDFDAFMGDVSSYIEEGTDPFLALDENHISDSEERSATKGTIRMQRNSSRAGFETEAKYRQCRFRNASPTISDHARWPTDATGRWNHHLLSLGSGEENLFPGIRGTGGAIDFFCKRRIKWWKGGDGRTDGPTRNMTSSQVACVNFLLPLAGIPGALLSVLRTLDSDVRDVVPILHEEHASPVEFEWIGLCRSLEGGHTRGAHNTSVDAFLVAETRAGNRRAYSLCQGRRETVPLNAAV